MSPRALMPAAADRFSGTIAIAKLGKNGRDILYEGAYGLADRERKIPNTLDTKFRIGSMNKMFTATSVLQLVQAGKIKLTDPFGNTSPTIRTKRWRAR